MKLVMQPEGSNLCGQACVAMVADITLEKSIGVFKSRGATSTRQVVEALRALGIACGERLVNIKKQTKPPLCLVVLHCKGIKDTHWVVYSNGQYLDPAFGVVLEYDDRIYETSFLPIAEVMR